MMAGGGRQLVEVGGAFQTVHAGHADIEQHRIDRLLLQLVQRIQPAVGFANDVDLQLACAIRQHVAQAVTCRRLVIDDEDAQGQAGCVHGCRE